MDEGGDEGGVVTSRPNGGRQVVKARRKLFGRDRQQLFLEHLAASCNVMRSAAAAGVTVQCVYQRRMRDAPFRDAWGRALEQGYARLETRLLGEAMGEGGRSASGEPPQSNALPVGERGLVVQGDLVLPEEPLDKDLALHLLREHKRGVDRLRRGAVAETRSADWAEVEDYFLGRLKALRKRLGKQAGPPPSRIEAGMDPFPEQARGGDE